MAKLTDAHKDNIQEVEAATLDLCVKQISAHANEPGKLTSLAAALAILATNDANRRAIAEAGGLQARVAAAAAARRA